MVEIDRWANIHPDLLNEIAKQFYSYEHSDYFRFRLVCKTWNSKLPKILNHKRNVWLVSPGVVDTLESHSLKEKGIHHLILPEMQNNLLRGSCYGWLICVMISDGVLRMLNPFNKAHFDLPPISTFPDVIAYNPGKHGDEYTMLEQCFDEIYTLDRISTHQTEVFKVVVSSPPDVDDHDDFMAVAIYGVCRRLAFYKGNDRRWVDIPTAKKYTDFQDVIFFQKKIYAVDWDDQLYEFNTKTKPLPVGGICEDVSPPDFCHQFYYACMNKYLIGCEDGNLLLLVSYFGFGDGKTSTFDIFTLDKDGKGWSKVHSLGNYTLIVGYNSSVRVLAHTMPNGKRNRVYYADNLTRFHDPTTAEYQDTGIFNVEDRYINRLLSKVEFSCPSVWLLP